MSIISTSRLENILVDISVKPKTLVKLVLEQNKIIQKHGEKITTKTLDEMVYLDAVCTESVYFSAPICSVGRKASVEYTTSNGFTVPNDSSVSLNVFSSVRDIKKYGDQSKLYIPERNIMLDRKLGDIVPLLPVWGIGRKYYIFSEIDGSQPRHPGYRQLITVMPSRSTVYLKRHNISTYK
ncbi:hypothetical protein BB559_000553 [Furculomyces boomerangus]|uniref:Uncharacterized protein n=2 Tax=Harpellales TaxID=61421 RepID=A0A2T9Z4U8_9FUNG|nr:hypothetical protein BB559_000553 [Furculomyces boomerangus]PVZ97961.1 hypothetical protein BB558_006053 [Smittium angustum]